MFLLCLPCTFPLRLPLNIVNLCQRKVLGEVFPDGHIILPKHTVNLCQQVVSMWSPLVWFHAPFFDFSHRKSVSTSGGVSWGAILRSPTFLTGVQASTSIPGACKCRAVIGLCLSECRQWPPHSSWLRRFSVSVKSQTSEPHREQQRAPTVMVFKGKTL